VLRSAPPKADYLASDGRYNYSFNICGGSNKADCSGVACQYTQNQKESTLAGYGPQKWSLLDEKNPGKGVRMSYSDGSPCWMGSPQPRYAHFDYICGAETRINTVVEAPTCTFTVTMITPYACGNSGPIISCNYTLPGTGLTWDLTPLKKSRDYTMQVGGLTYSLQFCGASNTGGPCTNYNNSACIFGNVFQLGLGGTQRSPLGQWSLISSDPRVGIEQEFGNGDACVTSTGKLDNGMLLTINLLCRMYVDLAVLCFYVSI
jgi:hypothetical protein